MAVGDIGFVIKCLNRIRKLSEDTAIILVSHNMQSISSFASRVIFMEHGCALVDSNNPSEAIDRYYQMVPTHLNEAGTKEALIENFEFPSAVKHGDQATAYLSFSVASTCDSAVAYLYIMDESTAPIVCYPLVDSKGSLKVFSCGTHTVSIPFGLIDLATGKYSFTIVILDQQTARMLIRVQGVSGFRVVAEEAHWGKIIRPVKVQVQE